MNHKIVLAIFAITLSTPLRADLTGNLTVPKDYSADLDAGATPSFGGDLHWNGYTLATQGFAKDYVIGTMTDAAYNSLDKATLTGYQRAARAQAIDTPFLYQGLVLAVFTNHENVAKVRITHLASQFDQPLGLNYATYILPPSPPAITSVSNGSSFITAGRPNSGITPSTLFAIIGTDMAAPDATAVLQDSTQGLPASLNGASISVTVAGKL